MADGPRRRLRLRLCSATSAVLSPFRWSSLVLPVAARARVRFGILPPDAVLLGHRWRRNLPPGISRRAPRAASICGDPVGGYTLEADGALALFRVGDIARLDLETGRNSVPGRRFADPGMKRFNDVTADFQGRVFAGTIGKDDASGGLHRIDPMAPAAFFFGGTGVANGMAFSLDRRTLLPTDSTAAKIFAFDYDIRRAAKFPRRVFCACGPDEGAPDGLCADREAPGVGALGRITRRAARAGRTAASCESLAVPAFVVTSRCFGGPMAAPFSSQQPGNPSKTRPARPAACLVATPASAGLRRSRLFNPALWRRLWRPASRRGGPPGRHSRTLQRGTPLERAS